MNFEDIKKMDKKQFEQFIFNIQNAKKKFCVRCGNFTIDKITISVNKSEKTNYSSKKLCNIYSCRSHLFYKCCIILV